MDVNKQIPTDLFFLAKLHSIEKLDFHLLFLFRNLLFFCRFLLDYMSSQPDLFQPRDYKTKKSDRKNRSRVKTWSHPLR